MFDDVLSATALIGVASLLTAAIASLGSPPDSGAAPRAAISPTAATVVTSVTSTRTSAGTPPATAKMPIYDLPRVVVTGQRMRDGDVVADGRTIGESRPALERR